VSDVTVLSIHWGGNWGYEVHQEFRDFARAVIDQGGIDVVFGHSSHHPKGIEVYHKKLIVYGAGDLINDYEGITNGRGTRIYRGELSLMYFPVIDVETGHLQELKLVPVRMRHFQLQHCSDEEISWLHNTMNQECRRLGQSCSIRRENDYLMVDF